MLPERVEIPPAIAELFSERAELLLFVALQLYCTGIDIQHILYVFIIFIKREN